MREGETHGQYKGRARNPNVIQEVRFQEAVQRHTVGLPDSFKRVIAADWRTGIGAGKPIEACRDAMARVAKLRKAERAGVKPNDTDADLCRKAESMARHWRDMMAGVAGRVRRLLGGRVALMMWPRSPEWIDRAVLRLQCWTAQAGMRRDLLDMPKGKNRTGIVRRLTDPMWWRRTLRKAHAVLLESSAIGLGLVRAGKACYVSDESLKRRTQQKARNAAVMSNVIAVNDRDDRERFTLADVAARGVANSAVRRAELMTRIAGFEVIANELGHQAHLVTVTCQSRMHKWRRGDEERTAPNPAYDGTLPSEAQADLSHRWAGFRAAAARVGLLIYGFRIVEPHHDGCPHWHLLLWAHMAGEGGARSDVAEDYLRRLFCRYFLGDWGPHERGAERHRITVEAIDPAKGSAVAYVAKYVAKNIDGYRVERDLYGNAALESSARVEAWASTWRIRQFQQIGGAPVTVWRELRRVAPGVIPMDAAQALHDAWAWCNVTALSSACGEPEQEALEQHRIRTGWAGYIKAQGGPTSKRREHVLALHREQQDELGRYGEPAAPRIVGVRAKGIKPLRPGVDWWHRTDIVESERAGWIIGTKDAVPVIQHARAVRALEASQTAEKRADAGRRIELELDARSMRAAPWTRVNNCTRTHIGPRVVRSPKRGRVHRWGVTPHRSRGGTPANLER